MNDPHCYKSGNPNTDKQTGGLGQCFYSLRTVFVDAAPRYQPASHIILYSRWLKYAGLKEFADDVLDSLW